MWLWVLWLASLSFWGWNSVSRFGVFSSWQLDGWASLVREFSGLDKRGFIRKVHSGCWKWFSYWKPKPVCACCTHRFQKFCMTYCYWNILGKSSHRVCCLYPHVLRSDGHILFSHIPQCWASYRVNWVKGKICTTFCKHNQFTCLKD